MTDLETAGPLQREERGTAHLSSTSGKEGIPASRERGNGEEKDGGEKKKREEENGGNERRYISSCKTTVNSSMSEYNPPITSIKRRGKREVTGRVATSIERIHY